MKEQLAMALLAAAYHAACKEQIRSRSHCFSWCLHQEFQKKLKLSRD